MDRRWSGLRNSIFAEVQLVSKKNMPTDDVVSGPKLEKHWTVRELAEAWNLAPSVIARMFRDETGVLRIGHEKIGRHRAYWTLRIPDSVARRVHLEWCARPA